LVSERRSRLVGEEGTNLEVQARLSRKVGDDDVEVGKEVSLKKRKEKVVSEARASK